jgi:transposase
MARGEEIPRTTPDEIENLIEQIRGTNLEPGSKDKLERLLRTILMLVDQLQRKKTSINKLREMIFGKRTERRSGGKGRDEKKESESGKPQDEQSSAAGDADAKGESQTGENEGKPKRKGHGHRAASDYSGARLVPCPHEQFKPGDDCPSTLCGGRLYDLDEPTVLLQFTGQPLLTATNYERQVLRCAKCQERYEAPLPEGVEDERYDATCDATIALMKYGGGLPWTRQAGLQEMGGVPLSETTMWERCEATADAALGIYQQLLRLAANGELLHTDDTWVRILSCLKEDEEKKGRATQTSGIVAKAFGRKIALYFSGRHHAGENLAELLKKRDKELGRPFQMSDALAANSSGGNDVVHLFCLAHARRTVYELEDIHPAECKVVLDAVGAVYGYDEQSVGLSPEQRLSYHQENSGPVMAKLKEWIERQFAERLVEPNSNLGKALQYWRNHWEKLTVWLREPGAPLDNNEAERALKRFILMRKNSLFFKTEHGAAVGDILASLIQTCRLNGVNAWDYLVTIIRNRSDARRNPRLYLPWNYKGEEEAAEALAA